MKITLAQLNPTIGDIEANLEKIKRVLSEYSKESDLIVFSELFITGYPPRDLLENKIFLKKVQNACRVLMDFSKKYPVTGVLVGAPILSEDKEKTILYNGAVLIENGQIVGTCYKTLLPTYDVFDETRYFEPSQNSGIISFKGKKLGISICEDMWAESDKVFQKYYPYDPLRTMAEEGADILINLSASPFYAEKEKLRYALVKGHAAKYGIPFVFVNQVGGNDELLFDGRSFVVNGKGDLLSILPAFEEKIETIDIDLIQREIQYAPQDPIESVYNALLMGVKDYVRKSGFKRAVVGLSGGIDSAVTCAIAAEALGGSNVLGVSMPSVYSLPESEKYSRKLAGNLGVEFSVISISDIYDMYIRTFINSGLVENKEDVNVTLQNIQARIRGNILMAFSNEQKRLLLSTGNKSEIAVGYCTLYGDMAGGLAVISDVPKTMVYSLADHINSYIEMIPQEIIERSPSAELRPGQLDSQALPPYEILDKILFYYIEEKLSAKKISDIGFDMNVVEWVIKSVNGNEYKRRQAPLGLKVTSKAFGSGRRMPIAAKYDL